MQATEERTDTETSEGILTINYGPQHPATHGTLRLVMELDGEMIVKVTPEIGYLHTGFEKLGETLNYNKFVALSDRMNYLSPLNNNIGFVLAVEKFMGVEVTPRCSYARVILAELSRMADHFLSVGLQAMDLGAFSLFLYGFREREKLYDIFERVTGARLTTSYTRVGGAFRDLPEDFEEMVRAFLKEAPLAVDEFEQMLDRNRIWHKRTRGVGYVSKEDAISYGMTGPLARAVGIDFDIRRDEPYLAYSDVDFDVPVRRDGDVYARYKVRLEEIRQSIRIIDQALRKLPDGPMNIEDAKIILPKKADVYRNMEALIYHFKLVMHGHGLRPPVGEYYHATESPNGELGFFIVSDGTERPWRIRVRPPSFINYTSFAEMVEGGSISDAVSVLGSLNVIAGELDR